MMIANLGRVVASGKDSTSRSFLAACLVATILFAGEKLFNQIVNAPTSIVEETMQLAAEVQLPSAVCGREFARLELHERIDRGSAPQKVVANSVEKVVANSVEMEPVVYAQSQSAWFAQDKLVAGFVVFAVLLGLVFSRIDVYEIMQEDAQDGDNCRAFSWCLIVFFTVLAYMCANSMLGVLSVLAERVQSMVCERVKANSLKMQSLADGFHPSLWLAQDNVMIGLIAVAAVLGVVFSGIDVYEIMQEDIKHADDGHTVSWCLIVLVTVLSYMCANSMLGGLSVLAERVQSMVCERVIKWQSLVDGFPPNLWLAQDKVMIGLIAVAAVLGVVFSGTDVYEIMQEDTKDTDDGTQFCHTVSWCLIVLCTVLAYMCVNSVVGCLSVLAERVQNMTWAFGLHVESLPYWKTSLQDALTIAFMFTASLFGLVVSLVDFRNMVAEEESTEEMPAEETNEEEHGEDNKEVNQALSWCWIVLVTTTVVVVTKCVLQWDAISEISFAQRVSSGWQGLVKSSSHWRFVSGDGFTTAAVSAASLLGLLMSRIDVQDMTEEHECAEQCESCPTYHWPLLALVVAMGIAAAYTSSGNFLNAVKEVTADAWTMWCCMLTACLGAIVMQADYVTALHELEQNERCKQNVRT
jgi:hypothetical protein